MTVKLSNASPASSAEIQELESELGTRLPILFRKFLRSNNGATPESNIFNVGDDNNCGVNYFIPTTEITKVMENSWYDFGERIPIAQAECGNFVLLGLNDGGRIYFWDHELPELQFELAANINDFIDLLQPFDLSDFELDEGRVKHVWIDPDFLQQLERDQPEILIRNKKKSD